MSDQQKRLDAVIAECVRGGKRPRVLLHSCCAPCSSYVVEYLREYFNITVFYYNPNIFPEEEYLRRAAEQKRFLQAVGIEYIEGDYDTEAFDAACEGKENCAEGGARCSECFRLRLDRCARLARQGGYDYFATTLSVSPHKNADALSAAASEAEIKYGIKALPADFKKRGGYARSIELSRVYGLYRQDYCGCKYSLEARAGAAKRAREAFIFIDADDTLFDFTRAERNSVSTILAEYGVQDIDSAATRYAAINAACWRALERGELTRDRLAGLRFEKLFEELNIDGDPTEASVRYRGKLAGDFSMVEGAREFLAAARIRGRLFLTTNGIAHTQNSRIDGCGIRKYFEAVFISEELGETKPSTAYFEAVAARIDGFDKSKAIIVGDSLSSDIAGGKAYGIAAVWFNPHLSPLPDGAANPDFIARDFDEVLKAIDTFVGGFQK